MTAENPTAPNNRHKHNAKRFPADSLLIVVTLILVAFGILMVFDTSFPLSIYNHNPLVDHNPYVFGRQQAKGLMIGLIAMVFAMQFGYQWMRNHAGKIATAAGILLLLVLSHHFGHNTNHATRWINLGHGIKFQPSEIAKLALVICLAAMLARTDYKDKRAYRRLAPPLAITGAYLLLIFLEPDLGTAIVLGLTSLTMLRLAGTSWKHLGYIVLIAGVGILLKGGLSSGQKDRLRVYMLQGNDSSGTAFQTFESKIAFGSGELLGVGWGQGRIKYQLPEANSDFIFATVGEELGLLGTSVMITMFGIMSWCGIEIARKTDDPFGRQLAIGITALLTWQTLVNVAVVTICIPETGVPLPFISFGSTSLVVSLTCVGILVSIAHNPLGLRRIARR